MPNSKHLTQFRLEFKYGMWHVYIRDNGLVKLSRHPNQQKAIDKAKLVYKMTYGNWKHLKIVGKE